MPEIKFYNRPAVPMEMHKVKIVQKLNLLPARQRLEKMQEAGFNTFLLHNGDIFMDMLTDSGVNAMSDEMQAAMLRADDAYADLTVNGLNAKDVELNMASGDSHFTDCVLGELSLNCASGEVTYTGTLYSLGCDTASGKVTAVLDNVPRTIEFDGVSADLDLTLPADAGFTVELDTLSGNFHSEFDTISRNDQYICGDGSCRISIDGVSGDVTLRKLIGERQKSY